MITRSFGDKSSSSSFSAFATSLDFSSSFFASSGFPSFAASAAFSAFSFSFFTLSRSRFSAIIVSESMFSSSSSFHNLSDSARFFGHGALSRFNSTVSFESNLNSVPSKAFRA